MPLNPHPDITVNCYITLADCTSLPYKIDVLIVQLNRLSCSLLTGDLWCHLTATPSLVQSRQYSVPQKDCKVVLFSQMVARSRQPLRRGPCYQETSLWGGTSGNVWSLGREATSFLSAPCAKCATRSSGRRREWWRFRESAPCFTLGPCESLLHQCPALVTPMSLEPGENLVLLRMMCKALMLSGTLLPGLGREDEAGEYSCTGFLTGAVMAGGSMHLSCISLPSSPPPSWRDCSN